MQVEIKCGYVLKTLHKWQVSTQLAVSTDIQVTQRRQLGQRRRDFPMQSIGPQLQLSGETAKKVYFVSNMQPSIRDEILRYLSCSARDARP